MRVTKKRKRKYMKDKMVMKNKLSHTRSADCMKVTNKEVDHGTESPMIFTPRVYFIDEENVNNQSVVKIFSKRVVDLVEQATRGSADDVLDKKHFIFDDDNVLLGFVQVSELESWEEAYQWAKKSVKEMCLTHEIELIELY